MCIISLSSGIHIATHPPHTRWVCGMRGFSEKRKIIMIFHGLLFRCLLQYIFLVEKENKRTDFFNREDFNFLRKG